MQGGPSGLCHSGQLRLSQAQPGWGTSPGNSHLCSEKLHGRLLPEGWGTTLG